MHPKIFHATVPSGTIIDDPNTTYAMIVHGCGIVAGFEKCATSLDIEIAELQAFMEDHALVIG